MPCFFEVRLRQNVFFRPKSGDAKFYFVQNLNFNTLPLGRCVEKGL
jgi:hypothetical protein